jgi:hypothetical protein
VRRGTPQRDIGNVAVIEDSGGIVETLNQFNLSTPHADLHPLAAATRYKYANWAGGYDSSAADQGRVVAALGDDDFRAYTLPFRLPLLRRELYPDLRQLRRQPQFHRR